VAKSNSQALHHIYFFTIRSATVEDLPLWGNLEGRLGQQINPDLRRASTPRATYQLPRVGPRYVFVLSPFLWQRRFFPALSQHFSRQNYGSKFRSFESTHDF